MVVHFWRTARSMPVDSKLPSKAPAQARKACVILCADQGARQYDAFGKKKILKFRRLYTVNYRKPIYSEISVSNQIDWHKPRLAALSTCSTHERLCTLRALSLPPSSASRDIVARRSSKCRKSWQRPGSEVDPRRSTEFMRATASVGVLGGKCGPTESFANPQWGFFPRLCVSKGTPSLRALLRS